MKLKEYIKNLNEFVGHFPDALELDVVSSSDDEGNSFRLVYYTPSLGNFEDGEFSEEKERNAVCIN